MHACIVVCIKHGIGDELTVIGALVSSILKEGGTVKVVTHHPALYSHPNMMVQDWRNVPLDPYIPEPCDLGVCVISLHNTGLPLDFDRTPLAKQPCLDWGYHLLDGDGRDTGLNFENGYEYSRFVLAQFGLRYFEPPNPFLARHLGNAVVLVPFGCGDLAKGMAPEWGWSVVNMVGEALPEEKFVMPMIESMPEPSCRLPVNIVLERRKYGDPELLRIHLRAKSMVVAEGGGYHIARAANIPALLVTSRDWLARVQHALPPNPRSMLLFDYQRPDIADLAEGIVWWLSKIPV